MKNNSVSDFVAAAMDAVLKSDQHKSLFGTQYKFASDDENDAKTKKETMCEKHDKMDSCSADDLNFDSDAPGTPSTKPSQPKPGSYVFPADKITAKPPSSQKADDMFADAKPVKIDPNFGASWTAPPKVNSADDMFADDDDLDADDGDDDLDADDLSSSAFNLAIDSLLTASAALDSVGMEKSSSLSLKLASLVVEAKKKDQDAKDSMSPAEKAKAKAKAKKEKEKAQKDTQMAKDKASKEKAKEKATKEKEKAKATAEKEKEKASKEKEKAKASKEKESSKKK